MSENTATTPIPATPPPAEVPPHPALPPSAKGRRTIMMGAGVLVAVGLAVAGFRWYIDSQNFVSTNDAFVKADIVAVSPKIAGRLAHIALETGQHVEAGQLAAELDASDIALQVKQAEANLVATKASLTSARTNVKLQAQQTVAQRAQAGAAIAAANRNLDAARANRNRAANDLMRSKRVYAAGGLSQQNLDAARTSLETAEAQMRGAAAQVENAKAAGELAATGDTQVKLREQAVVTTEAQINQTGVSLATAKQNLANTKIYVPATGSVARVPLNPGEMVAPGQPIASIVADGSLRVEAYLEETKVRRVRQGQGVEVYVDAYGDRLFHGKVTELGAATGSEFALIPANNAVGNFTKVVQRLPIKIAVEDPQHELRPGMSTLVRIDVRNVH